jgi:hypothetical protein
VILGCVNGVKAPYTWPSASGHQFTDGLDIIKDVGLDCAKAYCSISTYATDYPLHTWSSSPSTLVELAQTSEFVDLFTRFTYIVLTVFTSNGATNWWRLGPTNAQLAAEKNEVKALAKHFLSTYSGKTLVIQQWEGDWTLPDATDPNAHVDRKIVDFACSWLAARQRGVNEARAEHPSSTSQVLNAIEVNRVLDSRRPHLRRILRDIFPRIMPDMVSYSAYDSLTPGGWPATYAEYAEQAARDFTRALKLIERSAPGVPRQIGEIGYPELIVPVGWSVGDMIQIPIDVATSRGVAKFVYWSALDNDGRGYYFTRPDGTRSAAGAKFAELAGATP